MEYHHLTAKERYLILHHKSNGCSLRQIAKMLDRSASTISRELERNVSGDGRYRPDKADSYARARRWRSRRGSQFEEPEIELVRSLVQRKWSPEQVSRRLRKLRRLDAHFSDRGRPFQSDRGRSNGVVECPPGRRASTGVECSPTVHDQPETQAL